MKLLFFVIAAGLAPALPACADEVEAFGAHLQSTFVRQDKPSFRSPHEGPHSLSDAGQWGYSFTATAALGARLGQTEAYVDGEGAQGVAFSGLQGLAGFPNGELARTSGTNPIFYRARLFVRHVVGLGGDSVAVPASANQLASRYDKNRWVFTAGNVAELDVFDANAYSHDPRTQFLNWTVMTHGAWDSPPTRAATPGARRSSISTTAGRCAPVASRSRSSPTACASTAAFFATTATRSSWRATTPGASSRARCACWPFAIAP